MIDVLRTTVLHQFEAALATLNLCIERCPEPAWAARVANYTFSQAAFHTLFYADYYLQPTSDQDGFRAQPYHREHADFFRDYEEFEDRPPRHHYDRAAVRRYVEHVRQKAALVIAAETAESFAGRSGFEWLAFSRLEAHVYNTRHVQHHAAQLILRLRLDFQAEMPWVKSGWRGA
ncbi:MAG: DinB family protein [Phycisphaerae bacterium]